MNQTKRAEFLEARKKGGIAYRKEKARQGDQQRQEQPRAQEEEHKQMSGPIPTDEQDVETFSDFLAFHGGDQLSGENQSAAFKELSKMVSFAL